MRYSKIESNPSSKDRKSPALGRWGQGFIFIFGLFLCLHGVSDQASAKSNDPSPQRIVTLAPSLGELAADLLGLDLKRLVGVSDYSDYPPALKNFLSIGPYHQFNIEKVMSLKPDLILATQDGNPKDRVLRLQELGMSVVSVKTGCFEEIEDSMRRVASALGVPLEGIKMAQTLKSGIERIRTESRMNPPLKVLLQVGDSPLVVAGKNSFLTEALKLIGAQNVYAHSDVPYPHPSLEDMIQKDPDAIIIVALGENLQLYEKMAEKWLQFKKMMAVKNQRVHVLQSDPLLRPTLRLLRGIESLRHTLYHSAKKERGSGKKQSSQKGS